jgi:hypothetical protein
MNAWRDSEDEILLQLGFLPERVRHTVAWLFSSPERGSSYLLQLTDPEFELLPKYVPAPEHVSALEDLFKRLYPGFDVRKGRYVDYDTMYAVEHVCTHIYG